MNKRLESEFMEFVYKGEKTPFSQGSLAVVVFCVTLLIVATFTKIDVVHYWPTFSDNLVFEIKKYPFVPQVPVVILSAALLGARFGFLVVLLYLLCGFFLWPVFGFGGGIEYVKSYFFGYILGFFGAAILSGSILSKKYSVKNMVISSVLGVLSVHICGILYSFILNFFKSSFFNFDIHFILTQIAYDIIFSFAVVILAKPLKMVLWIGMKNGVRPTAKKSAIEQKSD